MAEEQTRSLDRLWEEFRVFRHDTRNFQALAEGVVHGDHEDRLARMEAVLTWMRVSEMSPRELGVQPEMARSYIDRGEEVKREMRESEASDRRRLLYVSMAQAAFTLFAVIVTYLVTRSH